MRADRLLSILLILQTRGRVTAGALAEMLNVSERTIYRDLDALDSAGIPLYTERGPGGGCMLVEGYRTNLTGLTQEEVHTLFIPGVSGPLTDLGLGQVLEDALLKLLASLPSGYRSGAERIRERILLDAAGWFQQDEPVPHLAALQEAVWQDRSIHLTYRRGDNKQIQRRVDPYGLVAKTSIWYLVGATGEDLRVYRVSRVQDVDLTRDRFERPPGFELASYWAEWCERFEASRPKYPVTVRLAPAIIPILPHIFGESVHTLVEQAEPPDAEGWITLRLTFETPEVARTHMLGFGTLADVIEPEELRASMVETAQRILNFYGGRA